MRNNHLTTPEQRQAEQIRQSTERVNASRQDVRAGHCPTCDGMRTCRLIDGAWACVICGDGPDICLDCDELPAGEGQRCQTCHDNYDPTPYEADTDQGEASVRQMRLEADWKIKRA